MALKLILLLLWASFCSSFSSVCEVSSNAEQNGVHVDCHCRGLTEIPKEFPANTASINLSNNLIRSVTNHSFLGISRLETLDLRFNVISSIEALAFWNCESLKTLKIQENKVCVNGSVLETLVNLQELEIDDCYAAEVFKSLSNLAAIDIVVNNECYFEGLEYLSNLRVLRISGHFICHNHTFDKLNSSKIQSLLIHGVLSQMAVNSLAPLGDLRKLRFVNTRTGLSKPLDALYALVGRNITTLVMEGVRIPKGPQDSGDVEDRTLTKERLKYISKICVSNLSAQNNRILFFYFKYFLNSPIAKCLKSLKLGRNILTYIPTAVLFEIGKFRQLEYLNIADQAHLQIAHTSVPQPQILSDISCQNTHPNGGMIFTFPKQLKELILSRISISMGHSDFDVTIQDGNKLKKVDFSFNGLTSLKHISGLLNVTYIDLSGNEGLYLPDDFFCNMKRIETVRLSDMSFPQYVSNAQGKKFLHCLPKLKVLDISGNRLVQLPTDLFGHNPLLEQLDLSRNYLSSVPAHLNILPNLHLLNVSSNSFRSLDRKTTDEMDRHFMDTNRNFQLNLEGNFVVCSCTNFPFLLWLSETEVLTGTKSKLFCIQENGNITKTAVITQNILKFWRKCKGGETLSVASLLGTLLLCGILVALLVETNKTKLAYFLLNAMKDQAQKRRRRDFRIDVYVSYADMDYRWACHELCAILEERNLNLFIWDRDAVPGDCTAEVITENVNQCWKTILFFTENYERDAWSYLTTMASINCVDNLNQERLILLLPENETPRVPECLLQVVPETCIWHVPREVTRSDAFWDELERAIKKET